MVELREDKKRQIIEFLEGNAEKSEGLVALEVDQVVEQFSDETFDESTIEGIIEELENEDLVKKKTAKLNIVYPIGYKDIIENRFDHLFESPSVLASYFVGTLVSLFLFDGTGPAFQYVFGDAVSEPSTLAVRGILFGVIGVYVIGRGIIRGFGIAQEHIQVLQEQKHLISPIFIIGSVVSLIVFGYTSYTAQSLTTGHLIQIISISVVSGVAIGEFLSDKDEQR